MKIRTAKVAPLCFAALAIAVACGSDKNSEFQEGGGRGGNGGSAGSAGSLAGGSGGSIQGGGRGGSPDGGGGSCATVNAKADLAPVFLAFAFDVSGSMGQLDYAWHDPELKWKPVVAATQQFFEAQASKGISASLRFFPDKTDAVECTASTYQTPEVPMTALPSPAFRTAIGVVDTETKTAWRGGTPTLYVVRGTIAYIEAQRTQKPGRYALVLVTDGYPQGCGSTNSIANVVTDVRAAEQDGIPTYVIGVLNPDIEGAPRTLTDLGDIAEAGGSQDAFIIDTGTPSETTADFSAAINSIRGRSISCSLDIPAPPDGRTFDKEKVRVEYKSGGAAPSALTYDQACTGTMSWRYDNPATPAQIELCASTCTSVQADAAAELAVNFTCDRVIDVPE
ncbi:MAG TPA: vWA domain-containing protein [Polyangiaceae bacterium]|nr:vWA domain-containing protein [Polyangiaceae bacterium]